jgi:dephospho-CoA kinase
MGRVLRVGLSGGIGSGKSTVARRFAEHGAVVIDADVLAREAVAPGSEGLAELVARFGQEILDAEGALDRSAMARRVFGDDDARAELNAVVHPRVASRTAELMADAPVDAIVVHDVPLLVEAGYAANYHLVVIVDAPVEDRVRRLVGRGMGEADARARIRAQADEEQRREAADVWLDNGGPVEDLLAAVDRLWADRLVDFESNVRLRRRPPKRPPRIVDYDPEWPREARRLISRIEAASGDRAVRVDHIGSTSVPGLPAKDILDLQVTVRSLADADALAEPLGAAGFPVIPEIRVDRVHPIAPEREQWQKRVHHAADPGRYANVHLRVGGTAAWRFALLFREWLRAEPAVRDEYLEMKRTVAAECAADSNHDRYAEAKEPWFDQALPRAEEWAARIAWLPPAV